MTRIKHTRERESLVRFGGHDGVEFPDGERVIDIDDDQADWAVETFDVVEYADSDDEDEDVDEDEE